MTRAIPFVLIPLLVGCIAPRPLEEYRAYNNTPRVILPEEYVAYLKSERFKNGELDHLPTVAIILHHDDVPDYLRKLGYHDDEWRTLQTGQTDPNLMYIITPRDGRPGFIVNRGLPGAGGISTQTAELAALGVKQIVHIGTAGFIGSSLPDGALVVSHGSYKDGAAVLLSDDPDERVSRGDDALSSMLILFSLKKKGSNQLDFIALLKNPHSVDAVGYTSPIFYEQPEGLIRDLIAGERFAKERPSFVEMEEAPFFETAKRAHVAAASIVIGSDRYTIDEHGKLIHTFFDSTESQELQALKTAIDVLTHS